jgi:hypothetical protein
MLPIDARLVAFMSVPAPFPPAIAPEPGDMRRAIGYMRARVELVKTLG